ncbi:hypothetical protein TIFTF001_031174 [Ficus carica]|uniref:Uncharacterized protein n=1 Tax=Ficus carica TaxID=3494 RepID=A0AA88DVV0_FICCA|nr:hypothetical protein TIFTF001_031174 [Ficus carica]
MIWPFTRLPASIARKGVCRGLWHCARAVGGVDRGCFEAEREELVAIHRPQIRTHPSRGLMDIMKARL